MSIKMFHKDETVGSCSVEGTAYEKGPDGSFEVEEAHAATMIEHGFTTEVPEGFNLQTGSDTLLVLAKKTKEEICAYALQAYGADLDPKMKKDDLLEAVADLAAKAADEAASAARLAELEAKDPSELTEEETQELITLQGKE